MLSGHQLLQTWILGAALAQAPTGLAQAAEPLTMPHCAFPEMTREARQTKLKGVRPDATAQIESSVLPIVVHYKEGVEPAYAAEILSYAETAWHVEVDQLHFRAPRPDGMEGGDARFDVYIVTDLDPGIGGYAGFSGYDESTPIQDAIPYLVINNAIDIRIRRFVVAHEFFHGVQMAYDWWEDLSFMEGTATWIADHVFDDENIYWRYYPYFNAEPEKPLDYVSIKNPFQYGSALNYQYLDERYGGGDASFLRKVWEACPQTEMDNEPDYMDAIAQNLPASSTLASAYTEFGAWRLLIGSRKRFARYREAGLWDERVDPKFQVDVAADQTSAGGAAPLPLAPYSHGFLRFARPDGEHATYDFEIAGGGATRFTVRWVALGADKMVEGEAGEVFGESALRFAVTPPADLNVQEVILIVTNVTDGNYDPDTSPWTGVPFSYHFSVR